MITVPNLLSGVRLILVPVLLACAWSGWSRTFLFCFVVSLLTDMTDGLLARRLHQATPLGAKLDSWADLLTFLALPLCAWWLRPEVLRQEALYISAGILFYLAAIFVGFCKFNRLTSYHTWGAKISAVLLGMAALVLFSGGPGWVFRWVIPFVVLAQLEEIAITFTLPELRANVPSLWHAMKLRQQIS